MKRRLIFSIFSLFFSITASAQKTDSARVHFETAFDEINGMLTGKNPLSFKRAVFLSENAYLDNRLSYSAFDFSIKAAASYCQRMAQNLPLNHPKEKPLGVNYAIFQHITDTTKHIFGKDTFDFLPFRYDFNDFSGQKSWESMFVTKLLRERTGNCRSLPYYYKLLADECRVEAFLALAPNHIYIKHRDVGQKKEGWQRRVYNIELTNGSFPMDGWLMASGYITLDAIRSGYYLDTLSQSQAVAMCLFDLGKAYERKFGKRDEFVSRCVERVLAIHPANINALLLKTELLKDRYEQTKTPADYQNVEKHCSTLVANGYREMPLDMYLNWLFEVRAKSDAFVNVKRQPKKFDTQKGNPYKNDTTMKIHMQTLTDGRYDEFPEFAETTYVGSAVYDVYKKRIIGFIKRDTLYSEATLEPEVVSRWLSTDPVFHPYESPYVSFANNPVYFIDPNGTTVGDYHTPSGEKIGYDKKNDGKHWIVTDKSDINRIKKAGGDVSILLDSDLSKYDPKDKNNLHGKGLDGDLILLPPKSVRDAIIASVTRSNSPNSSDKEGGFHEEGGVWGMAGDGSFKVLDAQSGPVSDPRLGEASINLFNSTSGESLHEIQGTWHVHPAGVRITKTFDNNETQFRRDSFDQDPWSGDFAEWNARDVNLRSIYPSTNIVVGARSQKIHICDYNKVRVSLNLEFFSKLK